MRLGIGFGRARARPDPRRCAGLREAGAGEGGQCNKAGHEEQAQFLKPREWLHDIPLSTGRPAGKFL